ncbi:hypothetical protein CHS0354_002648, partial [Potamilus streckersoni]
MAPSFLPGSWLPTLPRNHRKKHQSLKFHGDFFLSNGKQSNEMKGPRIQQSHPQKRSTLGNL